MDESKGEAFSSNASESTGTVAQESAKEEKVEEEGGSNNGDDIMVEVLGSHVYVDGICTSDGGGALGNNLNDEVVGGQDTYVEARQEEDGSRTLDCEGEEVISGDADMLQCLLGDKVKRDGDHDKGDQLGVQGVHVINSVKDKKQDTVATSVSGQPTESAVEDQLANKVQSGKMEQLQVDKQVFSSEQQLMEFERHSARSEIHHTGSSNSDMVDVFPEGSETRLKTEASLGPATAKGNSSIEETISKNLVSEDQKVNFNRDQEVQVNEASVEMVGDGTENTGILFADSASFASKSDLSQSHVVGLGDVDMQDNSGSCNKCDSEKLVERDQQQISGDENVTCSHSRGQDTGIDNELHDRNSGKENNCEQEQDNNAEEESKKQKALTPDSPIELHHAKYQLPPEDGEFCVSDLVWGKVRSHPWWPGQIFYPSDASDMAMKHLKKDNFLVAYFGDRTFAWNEASLLKPFRAHFSAAEKQNKSETFQNAVNCALEEVFRRVELGLACSCSPKDIYDKIKFQVVENTGIRQESSVKDVSDRFFTAVSFEPDNLLKYIKELAQFPCGEADKLDIAIAKAQLSALYCLRGYHPLPEFHSGRGLVDADTSIMNYEQRIHPDNVTDHPSPMDLDDERVSSARSNSEPKRGSYHKRKHDLKGGLYPCKRERSLIELMGGTFDSLDTDGSDGKPEQMLASPSSSKKRKAVDPFAEDVVEGRKTISLAKVSLTQQPKPSFKIGECISRVASQMTGSPSVLKSPDDRLQKPNGVNGDAADGIDLPSETYEDAIRKFSSSDQLFSELRLAASDPMKDFSFLNVVVSFFHDFRNSMVLDHLPGDKGGKRKRLSNSVIGSAETFEFEDMSDTYWTDRIVQNGSEEQLPHGNGRGQYQIVPVELEKPVQRGRKSRKRYSDGNHDAAAEKPPGYVNERAPAELVMTFSELNSVPSEAKLNKMFRHFGPLKESETEVDWETSRARVVFRRCSDAEVALNSAEKFNIFGPVVVKYQLNYSISESFKASLYAPALPETQIVTQSLDELNPLFGSTHVDHNQLIVSTLGEDASFMVSTLADQCLPLPSSFGEEDSYMTVTLAEETSNVNAHEGEGSFTITTTACMETSAAGISENGTVGNQTLAIAPCLCEQRSISDNTMGEQTARRSIITDETQAGSDYSNEPISTVSTSIHELPCADAAATVVEISTMPTSANEQTFTITTYTGEEQLHSSMTSGVEESTDAITVSEQTLVDREMPGEQASNITARLGKEASDMAASFGQESVPRSLTEGTLNADAALGEVAFTTSTAFKEKPSTVPAMSGEENSAGPTTSGGEVFVDVYDLGDKSDSEAKEADETLPLDASQSEESVGVAVSLADESLAAPATSVEEPSADHVIPGNKTLAVPGARSDETAAISAASGEKCSAFPAGSGKETSAVPVASGVETSIVFATSSEEPSAATVVSGEENLAVPAPMDEDLSVVLVPSRQETSAVPATGCEDLSTASMTFGEETSAVPATMTEDPSAVPPTTGEDLSAAPMTSCEETSVVSEIMGEHLSASPVASGEGTSAVPATTVEDLTAAPMASGEETLTIPATMVDDLSAAPMASGEEMSAVPATTSEDLSTVPMLVDDKTSAVLVGSREETLAAPVVSGEEASDVPATTVEDLSAVPVLTGDETSAVPVGSHEEIPAVAMVSGEETSAVPTTTGEDLSAAPMTSCEETSVVLEIMGEHLSASPVASGEGTSAVPATTVEDLSAAPMASGEETLAIPATMVDDLSAAPMASGEEMSAVPATTSEDLSTVPMLIDDKTSAVLVGSHEENLAAPVVSGEEASDVSATTVEDLSAAPVLTGDETSALPVGSHEEIPAVAMVSGEETSAVPTTTGEDLSAGPMLTDDETSVLMGSGVEIVAAPLVSGEETSAFPATTSEDTSVVPVGSGETPEAPVVSGEETSAVPVAFCEETCAGPAHSGKELSVVSVIAGEENSVVAVAAGEETSTVPATDDGETYAVPTTSSGEEMTTDSDRGDQSLTIDTKAEETLLLAATGSEETLTVDMTSMVTPTLAEGISTIATSTGDGTSSSLGWATSAVITSVNETPLAVTMTLHEAYSSIAAVGEATLTVPMTLDETSSTVTTALNMETASAGTTQVEEYAT